MRYGWSAVVATTLAVATACSGGSEPERTAPVSAPPAPALFDTALEALVDSGRVDLSPTGNRVITGPGSLLDTSPLEVQLDGTPRWVLPAGQSSWLVVLDDGSSVMVDVADDGNLVAADTNIAAIPGDIPPLATSTGVTSYADTYGLFADPLPDTRVVVADDALVALAAPTDRYAHAVLGDALEASAIAVTTAEDGSTVLVELEEPDVFEAVSPMIADVDANGTSEVVATVSNGDVGARLVAYSLEDGSVVAESEAIGLGNRWRNLLAVAPVGPNGEIEVIDIQTPHIGGILQYFRANGDQLELVASARTFSTHTIGSRNLDLGIVTDADGNGQLDVVVPTQGMDQLVAITRDDAAEGGTREVGRVDLSGTLVTNLAAAENDSGVSYAAGTSDGTLTVWP